MLKAWIMTFTSIYDSKKDALDYVMTQWSSWHLYESFNTVGLDIYG